MPGRFIGFAASLLLVIGVAACGENLTSGAACPSLCPQEQVVLNDTTFEAVSLDTTVSPYPAGGTEPFLPIVSRGDTLETRVLVRFDTIPYVWRHSNATSDSAITRVDSAYLAARIRYPLNASTSSFTIEAYDVDTVLTTPADTTLAAVAPLFRPDRLIGSLNYVASAITDSTLRVPISNAFLLKKITDSSRVRVGLRVKAGQRGSVTIYSREGGLGASLSFRVSPDTVQKRVTVNVTSSTPIEPAFQRANWADYVTIVRSQSTVLPAAAIGVGGIPGRRGYLLFNLPSRIIDSASVIRATLQLTQRPNRGVPDQGDTLTVYPLPVVASGAVSSISRAAEFLAQPGSYGLDSLRTTPADSGLRSFQLAGLLSQWRAAGVSASDRALVLRTPDEGTNPGAILFYSSEAAASLRPRLRVTYAKRVPFDLP